MAASTPMRVGGSCHGWTLALTMVAVLRVPAVAAAPQLGDSSGKTTAPQLKDFAALQRKWSLSGTLSDVGDGIGSTVHEVGKTTESVAKEVGEGTEKLAEETADAANNVGGAIGNLADEGERAAVKAAMSASGLCPKILKAIPGMVERFSAETAKALQKGEKDPSRSQAVCRAQATSATASVINKNLEGRPDVLKNAASWAVSDGITKACTCLKQTLSSQGSMRRTNPYVYTAAVKHKLLDCLSDIIQSEVTRVCPDDQNKRLRLFADEQEVAAAAGQPLAAPRLLPAAATLTFAGLVTAAAGWRVVQRRHTPPEIPAGGPAHDVEFVE